MAKTPNAADALKQYTALRESIVAEREQITARLREIDDALGLQIQKPRGGRRAGVQQNSMNLKDTVLQVLGKNAMTKQEILDAVLATGYAFATANPMNSLGVILYGKNPKFKNNHKRFSL